MNDKFLPIWNPFQIGYMESPYQHLKILREQNPVHKGINGRWIILKYEDVKNVLTNPHLQTVKFSKALSEKKKFIGDRGNIDKLSEISAKWLLFYDPPEHTEMRSIILQIWNSFNFENEIKQIVEENINFLSGKKTVDIVSDFATVIPTKVVCHILGLPMEDFLKLRSWSYAINSMFEPFATLNDLVAYNQKIEEFYNYISEIIEIKKTHPDQKFISRFIEASSDFANPLNKSEIISVIALMFFASIENSVNTFGQSILYLLRNPQQLQLLIEDESVTPTAIEELLRFISPNQYTTRIAAQDVEIRGQQIKKGELLMAATVSANFDEDIFENSGELDLRRKPNPHLSFGYGLHYCLGAKLARLELIYSIPALLRRFPQMTIDSEKKLEWDKIILNRGLKSLPVILN